MKPKSLLFPRVFFYLGLMALTFGSTSIEIHQIIGIIMTAFGTAGIEVYSEYSGKIKALNEIR